MRKYDPFPCREKIGLLERKTTLRGRLSWNGTKWVKAHFSLCLTSQNGNFQGQNGVWNRKEDLSLLSGLGKFIHEWMAWSAPDAFDLFGIRVWGGQYWIPVLFNYIQVGFARLLPDGCADYIDRIFRGHFRYLIKAMSRHKNRSYISKKLTNTKIEWS